MPDAYASALVRSASTITVGPGTHLAGDLQVGLNSANRSRVEVDGGQLILLQDSLRVGEYSGGEADFVLKNGAMHCVMDVFSARVAFQAARPTRRSGFKAAAFSVEHCRGVLALDRRLAWLSKAPDLR